MRLLHLRLIEEKVEPVEVILHEGIELRPLLHIRDKSNHILHNLSVGLTVGQCLREIPLGIANSVVGEELENLAVASLQFGDLVVHRLEILSELLQILLCILQLVRVDSQCPRQILGDPEVIDHQAMPLLWHHAVHAGNRLHEPVLLQAAVQIHHLCYRRVEARQKPITDAQDADARFRFLGIETLLERIRDLASLTLLPRLGNVGRFVVGLHRHDSSYLEHPQLRKQILITLVASLRLLCGNEVGKNPLQLVLVPACRSNGRGYDHCLEPIRQDFRHVVSQEVTRDLFDPVLTFEVGDHVAVPLHDLLSFRLRAFAELRLVLGVKGLRIADLVRRRLANVHHIDRRPVTNRVLHLIGVDKLIRFAVETLRRLDLVPRRQERRSGESDACSIREGDKQILRHVPTLRPMRLVDQD